MLNRRSPELLKLLGKQKVPFIVVAMNSRDRYEIIVLCKILHSLKQPYRNACLIKALNTSKFLKQCNNLAKQSGKSNISIYNKLLKISRLAQIPSARLHACQPAWSVYFGAIPKPSVETVK